MSRKQYYEDLYRQRGSDVLAIAADDNDKLASELADAKAKLVVADNLLMEIRELRAMKEGYRQEVMWLYSVIKGSTALLEHFTLPPMPEVYMRTIAELKRIVREGFDERGRVPVSSAHPVQPDKE